MPARKRASPPLKAGLPKKVSSTLTSRKLTITRRATPPKERPSCPVPLIGGAGQHFRLSGSVGVCEEAAEVSFVLTQFFLGLSVEGSVRSVFRSRAPFITRRSHASRCFN